MGKQSIGLLSLTAMADGAVAAYRAVGFDDAQATVQGQKVKGVAEYGAATGTPLAIRAKGTALIELGDDVAAGDSLIVDADGKAIPASGALAVAAGEVAVESTAADGAILTGADLPEFVFADALAAGADGDVVEVMLR